MVPGTGGGGGGGKWRDAGQRVQTSNYKMNSILGA